MVDEARAWEELLIRFIGEQSWQKLSDSPGSSAKKVYQHKLRQISRIGEVSLAVGHRSHLFYEIDKVIVAGQHERIDHDTGLTTGLHFFESLGHDKWIAAHRVLVEATRRRSHETGGRLAVSDHHDLLHLFALRLKQTAREAQTFRRVRVVWSNLCGRKFGQRQLFRTVVKEDHFE